MTALSTLLALLSLDDSEYLDGLYRSQSATEKFSTNLTKGFNAVGGAVVAGLGVAAGAAGAFIASSIEPASDLSETISKTTVVFGDSAQAILDWGENSAKALGMSKNTALSAVSTYGNLFRSMKLGEDVAANMSTGLVNLSADIGSFNNMDPTEVLDKFRAMMSGEFEPGKALGFNINQAILQEKALEMGLWDGVDALSASAKAQATYALIMEQSALAQGDFARTSDGLANQQRILTSQWENIRATVGSAVLPLITQLATTLSDYLARPETMAIIEGITQSLSNFAQQAIAYLPQVIAGFQGVFGWLQANQGVVVGILAALGVAVATFVYTTVIPAAVATITAIAPVLLVMAAIAAVGYLVYQAWTNNWGGIRDIMTDLWNNKLQPIFAQLRDWLSVAIPAAVAWLSDLWNNTLLPALQTAWAFLQNNVFPILGAVANVISAVLGVAIRAVAGYIVNVWLPHFRESVAFMQDKVLPVIRDVANWLNDKLGPAFRWVGERVGDLTGWLNDLADKLSNMELPDWMTPGSPTPWEIGLWGVQDALDSLSRESLPRFQASLQVQAVPVGTTSVAAATPGSPFGPRQGAEQDPLMREIYRMLLQLPQTIANANRDAFEKVKRE